MKILLTGPPGIGKSTALQIVLRDIGRQQSTRGIVCREVRLDGVRTGFTAVLSDGRECDFMRKCNENDVDSMSPSLARVGSYVVDVSVINTFVVPELIASHSENPDLIYIDEIGRAQHHSELFMQAVLEILSKPDSHKCVLATIVLDDYDWNVDMKNKHDVWLLHMTVDNRDFLPKIMRAMVLSSHLFNQLSVVAKQKVRILFHALISMSQFEAAKKLFHNSLLYIVENRILVLERTHDIYQLPMERLSTVQLSQTHEEIRMSFSSFPLATSMSVDLSSRYTTWYQIQGLTSSHNILVINNSVECCQEGVVPDMMTATIRSSNSQHQEERKEESKSITISCDCDLFNGRGKFSLRGCEVCSHIMTLIVSECI